MNRPNLQEDRPSLQTRQLEVVHPSHGIGNPYSQDMRNLVMFISEHLVNQENDAIDSVAPTNACISLVLDTDPMGSLK